MQKAADDVFAAVQRYDARLRQLGGRGVTGASQCTAAERHTIADRMIGLRANLQDQTGPPTQIG